MGKTCHLPGKRNHLVGDQERLQIDRRDKKPEHFPPFALARPVVNHRTEHRDKYSTVPEAFSDGPMRNVVRYISENNEGRGEVVQPFNRNLGLVTPVIFSSFFLAALNSRDVRNTTYRHRLRHYKAITETIRLAHEESIRQDHLQSLSDIALRAAKASNVNDTENLADLESVIDPGATSKHTSAVIALEGRYTRIGNRILAVKADLSDRPTRELFEEDAYHIQQLFRAADIPESSVTIDALDPRIPLFVANQNLHGRNRPTIETPLIPPAIQVGRLTPISNTTVLL